MVDISFNKIDAADYPAVAGLYNYYIKNSTATYHISRMSSEDIIDFFEIRNCPGNAFIIQFRGEFAGFCLFRQYSKKEGYKFTYEITIYLEKSFIRKGIGTIALEFLENNARRKGIRTLLAGICAENAGSLRLIEKSGYEKCGYFRQVGYKFNRFLDTVYYQKIL